MTILSSGCWVFSCGRAGILQLSWQLHTTHAVTLARTTLGFGRHIYIQLTMSGARECSQAGWMHYWLFPGLKSRQVGEDSVGYS